jgi:IclR family acetate operon transcriptional repressor
MVESDVEQVGVRPAAKALGLTPSGAHRIMSALVDEGFLKRDEQTSQYALGLEMMLLAHRAVTRWPIRNVANAPMRAIVDACNEAAFLNIFDRERGEIIGVAAVESTQALRYVVELHKWKPVYVGAAGWAVMAHLSREDRAQIAKVTGLAPLTDRSVVDLGELEVALKGVRDRGYALTHGQRIPGAVGIAAPIFDHAGEVVGSVGLSMPELRFSPGRERQLAALVQGCAGEIMKRQGGIRPQKEGPTKSNAKGDADEHSGDAASLRPRKLHREARS